MRPSLTPSLIVCCALLLAIATPPAFGQADTEGQFSGRSGRHHRNASAPPRAAAPDPLPAIKFGPHLDPGAVLCRSEADLRQHLAAVAARRDGNDSVAEPRGCRRIQAPTQITVLSRSASGPAEVQLPKPGNETGWTDSYLPQAQ